MKKLTILFSILCLTMVLAVPASALDYDMDAPSSSEYGRATSVEPLITADRGEMLNVDVSKNAALVPPAFGNASAYALGTGTPLTPNLNPGTMPTAGAVINGNIVAAPIMPDDSAPDSSATKFTAVTDDLYYSAGHLGTLRIPSIGVNARIYEGTDSTQLAKGAGHFEETSIWNGNVALAGHNRGTNEIFGQIHTLNIGDKITLTTRLGTRTYEVVSVSKISETDRSGLAPATENILTLYTCVRDQREYRWCVVAQEVR